MGTQREARKSEKDILEEVTPEKIQEYRVKL